MNIQCSSITKNTSIRSLGFFEVALLGFVISLTGFNLKAENGYIQPIEGFKITETSGYLSLRYFYDELEVSNLSSSQQHEVRPTYQEEFVINAKAYAYHPNFLSIDFGAGLLLDQSTLESVQGDNSTEEELINLNARFEFLNKKPYPFSIYYHKNNPSVSTGLSGRFIQENIKYGFDFDLLSPVTPVQITLKAFREDSDGEGFDQVVNDLREQVYLKLHYPYGSGEYAQLSMQENFLDSNSGSPGLEIIQRVSTTRTATIDTKNTFGNARNVDLLVNVSAMEREDDPFQEELTLSPKLSWQHSETLNSYYQLTVSDYSLDYVDQVISDIDSHSERAHAGVSTQADDYNAGVRVQFENTDSDQLDYASQGLVFDASKSFKLSKSEVTLAYKANFDQRDQQSVDNALSVFGEEHILSGTVPVELLRSNIIETSITVSNQTRTQLFIVDIDYRIIQIGEQFQIQRIVGGNILDGQVVLVDYNYQTGGTFAYDNTGHNLSLNLTWNKQYELYMRYRQSDQDLREGLVSSISLNDLEMTTYGIRADRALLNGMLIGAEYFYEDTENLDQQGSDISSYNKDNLDYYLELPLSRQTNIRLSGRRVIKEFQSSDEDTDLTGYILRIKSRPTLRMTSSFESSYEKDVGATIERRQRKHRFLSRWKMRQLRFDASILYTDEQTGTIRRDRWEAKFELRRDFF